MPLISPLMSVPHWHRSECEANIRYSPSLYSFIYMALRKKLNSSSGMVILLLLNFLVLFNRPILPEVTPGKAGLLRKNHLGLVKGEFEALCSSCHPTSSVIALNG